MQGTHYAIASDDGKVYTLRKTNEGMYDSATMEGDTTTTYALASSTDTAYAMASNTGRVRDAQYAVASNTHSTAGSDSQYAIASDDGKVHTLRKPDDGGLYDPATMESDTSYDSNRPVSTYALASNTGRVRDAQYAVASSTRYAAGSDSQYAMASDDGKEHTLRKSNNDDGLYDPATMESDTSYDSNRPISTYALASKAKSERAYDVGDNSNGSNSNSNSNSSNYAAYALASNNDRTSGATYALASSGADGGSNSNYTQTSAGAVYALGNADATATDDSHHYHRASDELNYAHPRKPVQPAGVALSAPNAIYSVFATGEGASENGAAAMYAVPFDNTEA